MCGIVGYVGAKPARSVLLAGLEKLEYRGYDSAGISVLGDDGEIESVRAVGNLSALRGASPCGRTAHGRRRGRPPPASATPAGPPTAACPRRTRTRTTTPRAASTSCSTASSRTSSSCAAASRPRARASRSETDAEVVAHLVADHYDGDLVEAVRAAYAELRGHYAFVAMSADEPDVLVGARKECPLVVGRGEGEQFLASAIPAFLEHTRRVQYINDDEIVAITPEGVALHRPPPASRSSARSIEIDWDAETAEKGGYETFMLKEIHEQADAVAETIADRTARRRRRRPRRPRRDRRRAPARRRAGSSSSPAAPATTPASSAATRSRSGRACRSRWTSPPSTATATRSSGRATSSSGSPSRARPPTRSPRCAWPASAARRVLAITNIMGSQATRDADGVLFTRAGHGDRRGGDQDLRLPRWRRSTCSACAWPSCAAR